MKNPLVQIGKALASIGHGERSRHWPSCRRAHLKKENWCRGCGSPINLAVHHILPFHRYPSLELEPTNLITLCERIGKQCHLKIGHLGNWHVINPHVSEQATATKTL